MLLDRQLERRGVTPRIWLVVVVVVLVLLVGVLDAGQSWTRDDGVYADQAIALSHGGWGIPTATATTPEALAAIEAEGGVSYAYVRHPAWPLVQSVPYRLGGNRGMRVLPALAVVAAAWAAFAIARETDSRRPEVAAALVLVSPVLVHGTALWALAPSSALAGFAFLAAIRAGRARASWWYAVVLAGCIAGGVLLRSEGALVSVAIAASAWVVADRGRGLAIAATALISGGAAYVLELAWIDGIVAEAALGQPVGRSVGGGSQFGAAATSLWAGGYADAAGSVLGVAGLLLIASSAYVLRSDRPSATARGRALLVGAACAYAVRILVAPSDLITGFFAAWPVIVLALASRRRVRRAEAFLLSVSALISAAVLLTQYSDGGGLQWGGRFLATAIVPIAVVATDRLVDVCDDRPSLRRPIAVIACLPIVLGLVAVGARERTHGDAIRSIQSEEPDLVLSAGAGLPGLAWNDLDRGWLHVQPEYLPFVLEQVDPGATVALVGYTDAVLGSLGEDFRVSEAADVAVFVAS